VNLIAFVWGAPTELAYAIVFAAALAKSAALPVPGTTTLIAAVVIAREGDALVPALFACAVVGAVIGGHLGYLGGARGGRWALTRRGRLERHRAEALEKAEAFWARHGTTTVVVARLFPVLRHLGGFLAGTNRMPMRRFAVANATGAVLWAAWGTAIALIVGTTAGAVGTLGAVVAAIAVAGALGAVAARRALGSDTSHP
jgi:membrane protein DedA with SNARE-associated domain